MSLAALVLNLSLAIGLLALAVALALRSWLTLCESSLLHVSEAEAQQRAAAREPGAQAVAGLLASGDYLGAFLLSVNALLILIAVFTTAFLAASDLPVLERALIHLLVISVVVVASELTPYAYGGLFARRIAYAVGPACLRFTRLLAPPARLMGLFLRLVGLRPLTSPHHPARFVTAADIQAAAELSEEGGEVEPEVGRMLDEVMELSETTVQEIMTPRVEIVGVRASAGIAEMIEAAIDSGYSRLPVYEGDLDNCLGILFVSDLAGRAAADETATARELARPALLTPQSRAISDLLREMRERATHMALVIGESGGTEGLVTIEDILEELVGEIEDEHDAPEDDLVRVATGELLAEGRVRLSDVEEVLGVTFPATEAETVAGLVSWLLGGKPREGESLSFGGVSFRIEEAEGQQIRRVRIVRAEEGA